MVKGYDLFGDHGRNLPTPHGSGTRPMYADMGKSCRPGPNRKIEYPHVVALFTLDSHNTSYFFKRELHYKCEIGEKGEWECKGANDYLNRVFDVLDEYWQ